MISLIARAVSRANLEYVFSNILAVCSSFVLIARYYKPLLVRLGYIALLCYWYLSTGYSHGVFNEVLLELTRYKKRENGAVNHRGTHWILNIGEIIITNGVAYLVTTFFPTYVWTNSVLVVLITLLYPCNDLYHLWLQRRIASLTRLDRRVWTYASLVIESACLACTRAIDCEATRTFMRGFWSVCYKIYNWLTPERGDRIADTVFIASIVSWRNPRVKSLMFIIHNWMIYRLWFRKLGCFLNPDPPEYKYTPLKDPQDIRVILLPPRFGFGQICCSMMQGPHMRLLFYEAVSYKWDNMNTTETILVDGCRMRVTKSVFEILASYSSLIVPQLLWIDALCIDQNNEAEKSQQVPMMDKIYQNALFTTLFIGRSPLISQFGATTSADMPFRYDSVAYKNTSVHRFFEDARLATDLLKEFSVLATALKRRGGMDIYKGPESSELDEWRRRQWAALLKMLQHPVFERIWIVQEIVLSQHVEIRVGDEVMDWDLLADGVEMLEKQKEFCTWLASTHGIDIGYIQQANLSNITRMQKFRQSCRPRGVFDTSYDWLDGWDLGIGKLLHESVFFKATDPRDLVYGIVSLCDKPLKVSYKLSVEEVFLDAAKALVEAESFPTLLHVAGIGNARTHRKLPSWVPDWTNAPKYKSLQNMDDRKFRWNRRRKPKSPPELPMRFLAPKSLRMTAICIDTIEELGPGPIMFQETGPPTNSTTRPDPLTQILLNYQTCISLALNSPLTANPYPHTTPPRPLQEAVHLTVTLNKAGKYYDDAWQAALALFRKRTSPQTNGADARTLFDAIDPDIAKTVSKFEDILRLYTGARRLFISRRGFIGLCPPYTKKGDMIHVAPDGIAIPFLLRRSGDGIKRYLDPADGVTRKCMFVGECYCHGLIGMDGKWSVGGEGEKEGMQKEVEIV